MGVQLINSDAKWKSTLAGAGKVPVLVDFSATWCGPCKLISPVFEAHAEANKELQILFLKVDVDEAPGTAQECGVKAMPTFQLLIGGAKVDELVGADKAALEKLVAKAVAAAPAGAFGGTGRVLSSPGSSAALNPREAAALAAERRMAAAASEKA